MVINMTTSQQVRWKAELEIIQSLGRIPSSREMTKLLQERKGIIVNHNTVNNDLKKDLESLTEQEYENQKNGIISMLDNLVEVANNIATNEEDNNLKLKAMNTLTKLSKTKTDILNKFRKANAELNKKERPIYKILIGEPEVADGDFNGNTTKTKRNDSGDEKDTGKDE